MQRLEVSGAVRPLYGSLGVKGLITVYILLAQSVHQDYTVKFGYTKFNGGGTVRWKIG